MVMAVICFIKRGGVSCWREFEAEHRALGVRFQALQFDVLERSGRQNAASQLDYVGEIFLAVEFVDGWPADHSAYRDLRAD